MPPTTNYLNGNSTELTSANEYEIFSIAASGYQCREQSHGDVLGHQHVITDDEDARVVLALDPRVPGHTIVVWKRHVHDFSELDDRETARLFLICRDVARALRTALTDVERVYQVTMCDGPINHLHVQLIPRYAGTPIGSQRLIDPRGPVLDGDRLAGAIRGAYQGLTTSSDRRPIGRNQPRT